MCSGRDVAHLLTKTFTSLHFLFCIVRQLALLLEAANQFQSTGGLALNIDDKGFQNA